MMTISKRMLPIRLGLVKRTLFHLITGSSISGPAALAAQATSAAAPARAAAAATPAAQALQFTDTAVTDVIADIEAQAAAAPKVPLGLPQLPPPKTATKEGRNPKTPSPTSARGSTLADRRAGRGLKPGQWDPAAQGALLDTRSQELLERKSYLRNFWYAAGTYHMLPLFAPFSLCFSVSVLIKLHFVCLAELMGLLHVRLAFCIHWHPSPPLISLFRSPPRPPPRPLLLAFITALSYCHA